MKREKPSYTVSVAQPCNESWDKMDLKGKGRFCTSCRKTVMDFSQLGDKELYSYLSKTKELPCGRFHSSQLNRRIEPPRTNSSPLLRLKNLAAASFALLSIQHAQARKSSATPVIVQPYRPAPLLPQDSVTISGMVRNAEGKALANAEVIFDNTLMAKSDEQGHFSFTLQASGVRPGTLVIRHEELVPVARSYHPTMQSASYDIVLQTKADLSYCLVMGLPFVVNLPDQEYYFDRAGSRITDSLRKKLEDLATILRQNPDKNFNITLYTTNGTPTTLSQKRHKALINYLTDNEGIAPERLITRTEKMQGQPENLVRIAVEE